jgi:ectoine hydroxylase-related dioxygenase (phytanoyl-CoA dioxygenase family)
MFSNLRALTEAELSRHVQNVARDGFSIMHDAVGPSDQRAILDELDRLEAVRPGGDLVKTEFLGLVTRRWVDLLNDADLWQDIAVHPWVLQVVPHVIGDDFLLSTMTTMIIGDGEPQQPIHADDGVYAFPRPHPNLSLNTIWAMTDFTDQNGATRVVPGSNNWPGDPRYRRSYDSIALEMPAGSIAFVVGSCYHGAGANKSGADRPALAVSYCNGAMRQQENLMLSVHPERMMVFAPELQDILGFRQCGHAGFVFGQDPRAEMERRYPIPNARDPYLEIRNSLHTDRISSARAYV